MVKDDLKMSIYKIIRAYGIRPTMFDDSGDIVYYPEKATRYYMKRENIMVNIDDNEVSVVKGGVTDYEEVRPLIEQIKDIVASYSFRFDLKSLGRVIKAKEFSPKSEPMLAIESKFPKAEGGVKTSYIKLSPQVWIIIKHRSNMLDKDKQRTMPYAIEDLYVKNGYERTQCPCHLKTAKALSRHVQKGGSTKDRLALILLKMGEVVLELKELIRVFRHKDMKDELRIAKKYKAIIEKDLHALSRKTKYEKMKDDVENKYKYVDSVDVDATLRNIDISHDNEEFHTCGKALSCMDTFIENIKGNIDNAQKALKKLRIKEMSCYNDFDVIDFQDTKEKILYIIDGVLGEMDNPDEILEQLLREIRDDLSKDRSLTSYHKSFLEQLF